MTFRYVFESIVMDSENQEINLEDEKMWQQASFVTRLVASSVRVSETAGNLIKVSHFHLF